MLQKKPLPRGSQCMRPQKEPEWGCPDFNLMLCLLTQHVVGHQTHLVRPENLRYSVLLLLETFCFTLVVCHQNMRNSYTTSALVVHKIVCTWVCARLSIRTWIIPIQTLCRACLCPANSLQTALPDSSLVSFPFISILLAESSF